MLLMTVYAGFPAGINGTNVLREVINERENKVEKASNKDV